MILKKISSKHKLYPKTFMHATAAKTKLIDQKKGILYTEKKTMYTRSEKQISPGPLLDLSTVHVERPVALGKIKHQALCAKLDTFRRYGRGRVY